MSPEENAAAQVRSCIRWWRLLAAGLLASMAALAVVLVLVAQRHWLAAPLAYMPWLFAAPLLAAFALPGWWWGRMRMLALLATALAFHFLILGWRPLKPAPADLPGAPALRAVFVNRGDQELAACDNWVMALQPDLVALTDVRGRNGHGAAAGQPAVAGLPHCMRVGEHALASRYPFKGALLPPIASPQGAGAARHFLPAARFEVEAPGGAIAVYVVHINSPRDALSKYRQPRLWKWTLFGTPPGVQTSITIDHYWREQNTLVEGLLQHIEAETLPVVVLGDWNLPDFGPRYRRLTRHLQDAHVLAGSGFGHTFPGDLRHWAAFGQPWMRIDYVLTDRGHWVVGECRVQSADEAGDSQHRGLFTVLQRRPAS